MEKSNLNVSLPEGVSLSRIAHVLVDAWEADPQLWTKIPLQLREGGRKEAPTPVPADAIDFFRLLAEPKVAYMLVGGIAMLTYVRGRNTKDVDVIMSVTEMQRLPELQVVDHGQFFIRARFNSIRVNLLLTSNPLFKLALERFTTTHQFAELEVPISTVQGLILLKLYALPPLYRQFDWDRIYIYESDVKQLVARYTPSLEPLFTLLEPYLPANELTELRRMLSEEQRRRDQFGGGTGR